MLKILLLTVILLAFALLALGVQTFFSKRKKFPSTEVGHNKDMAKLGISCAKHEEYKCHAQYRNGKFDGNSGCGCSCS